jgi:DNA-binding CsgD family transcriptional regulator
MSTLGIRLPEERLRIPRTGLTSREKEVLQLVANGSTNRAVGHALHLAEETIKSMMQSILRKLGVRDRTHAVAVGIALGLVSLSAVKIPVDANRGYHADPARDQEHPVRVCPCCGTDRNLGAMQLEATLHRAWTEAADVAESIALNLRGEGDDTRASGAYDVLAALRPMADGNTRSTK